MLKKSSRTLLVLAVALFIWSSFGATESVADKEPEFNLSTEQYIDNVDGLRNKVVLVDGTVTSMGYTENGIMFVLDNEVSCYFKGKEADNVIKEGVSVGDYTTVKGQGNGHNDLSRNYEINYCTIK